MSAEADRFDSADKLFQAAMELPEDARIRLAVRLMDTAGGGADPEWEAAWAAEIERRAAELRQGAVETIPWADVRCKLWRLNSRWAPPRS